MESTAPEKKFYRGSSMLRVFRRGDEIFLRPVSFSVVRTGDIVCFHARGRNIIHRVVSVEPGLIRTQGDHCRNPDRDGLTNDMPLLLAQEFLRGGRMYRVVNGSRGRWIFRKNQLLLKLETAARRLVRPLEASCFDILRIPLTGAVRFGGELHYFWRGRLIVRCVNGENYFCHPFFRILFRTPKE